MEQRGWRSLLRLEDWWAVWLGFLVLALATAGAIPAAPKIATWSGTPLAALPPALVFSLVVLLLGIGGLTGGAARAMGEHAGRYAMGFPAVFVLAVAAMLIASHRMVEYYSLEYVIWALLLGLAVSNSIGVPPWLRAAARTELFIKTGLVLLGAEILFGKMLQQGAAGLGVAWGVTPIVFVFMYFFGTRTLAISSKPLVATISAATSVCGVSAAIAVGAATKAKRQEISYAISLSLLFTVGIMILMPALARLLDLDQAVGGAWIGGTVDSTGAVVASGAILGSEAMQVAAVVKMIQNIMIGILAFVLAILWVTRVERRPGEPMPRPIEIWIRFPKFILGFAAASFIFSAVLTPLLGESAVEGTLKISKGLRGWLFALAFVSIGLESNFRELWQVSKSVKPVLLYTIGQTFNIVLTLLAAWYFFGR
jgi:uncharacterized integral membrane protein (TIGR00698 family)